MNEDIIIKEMITFIEEKEKQLQVEKLTVGQTKNDIVKSILDKLENMTAHENQ